MHVSLTYSVSFEKHLLKSVLYYATTDLKPRYVLDELRQLSAIVSPTTINENLRGLNVIITHVKPLGVLEQAYADLPKRILRELRAGNDLGVHFQMAPDPGHMLKFD